MELIAELPTNCHPTRLDFGYIEAYTNSGPWSCWMQVHNRMYRGHGVDLQSAFDNMKASYLKNEPVFVRKEQAFEIRKEISKKDITELF